MSANYCCYFDHRYLPRGLAMIRSLRKWDLSATVWVLCLSDSCYQALLKMREPGLQLIQMSDLETAFPALVEARANRTLIEYYFTCTPSLVRYVLEKVDSSSIVTYLDSDLYFFSDPGPLFQELGGNSVSIMPHRFPSNLKYLEKFGLYNVGWMSLRKDALGVAALTWWQDRCIEWCYDILDGDRFADQKYLNRIATHFKGVVVLTHRGANLAPWNIGGHSLSVSGQQVFVDKQWPLIFFHFHGLRQAGETIYIPGHFRYRAPFDKLIRLNLYQPYVDALDRIARETSPYLIESSSVLMRSSSRRANYWGQLISLMKKPVKNFIAIVTGEFVIANKGARLSGG